MNAEPPGGDALEIAPLRAPPDATVVLPGSKSLTNRALVCAAGASGTSRIEGALFADDTLAMAECLTALGAGVTVDEKAAEMRVTGAALGRRAVTLDARQSGTTGRFVLPLAALGRAAITVDGDAQLRARPFHPLLDALAALGVTVERSGPGGLPATVTGPLVGGEVRLPGDVSSQFLSALLLAGPLTRQGVRVRLTSPLVSASYVAMTASVMAAFGGHASGAPLLDETLSASPGGYEAADYIVEPDASAASYFFAAAAITGGRVVVEGLGRSSVQGDLRFVDVLAEMGATVLVEENRTEVRGGPLTGITVDLSDCSDTAPTLAAVAAFAEGPTRVTGIGFIRNKESDRIAAPVAELCRAGVDARAEPDGFIVHPAPLRPARLRTYGDHRLAMSFALLGLRQEGIVIEDPGCVAKTFPEYFARLAALAEPATRAGDTVRHRRVGGHRAGS